MKMGKVCRLAERKWERAKKKDWGHTAVLALRSGSSERENVKYSNTTEERKCP